MIYKQAYQIIKQADVNAAAPMTPAQDAWQDVKNTYNKHKDAIYNNYIKPNMAGLVSGGLGGALLLGGLSEKPSFWKALLGLGLGASVGYVANQWYNTNNKQQKA